MKKTKISNKKIAILRENFTYEAYGTNVLKAGFRVEAHELDDGFYALVVGHGHVVKVPAALFDLFEETTTVSTGHKKL